MSVISRKEIKRRLDLDVAEPEGLVITPLLNADDALGDEDTVDLRLGCHFLLPRTSQQPFFCPDETSPNTFQVREHVPLGDYLVIPAHQTVLGSTLEFIKLPYDVSGQILTKSSVARTFIVVETAPWIHPRYRGCLTLEIANVSNTPLLLYPGRPIAQLILMDVWPKPEEKHRIDGTYIGPIYPEAPRFKSPEEELKAIGVKRVWTIPQRELR